MSPYRTADTVSVKIFKSNEPEQLETLLNSWISENTNLKVIDILYSSHQSNNGSIYTALIRYAEKIFEEQM